MLLLLLLLLLLLVVAYGEPGDCGYPAVPVLLEDLEGVVLFGCVGAGVSIRVALSFYC